MQFSAITLQGKDVAKFLQGQLTINVQKLTQAQTACAIANLKGRIEFGLWAYANDEQSYTLITAHDCVAALQAHIKKYGAFSKFHSQEPMPVYATVKDDLPFFTSNAHQADFHAWATVSIDQGNYWIVQKTQGLFQPQELRLHQRGGVDYDKGCYLGQEIIARLYFKASPKAYLHRVQLHEKTLPQAGDKLDKIIIVNSHLTDNDMQALVVGTADDVAKVATILPLPTPLMASVARG